MRNLVQNMVVLRVKNYLQASKLNCIPIWSFTSSDHYFNYLYCTFSSSCLSIDICFGKVNMIRMNYIKLNEG